MTWPIAAVLAAAFVTALVAFYGHRITRYNAERQASLTAETARLQVRLSANLKLAEMRQAWINSLRDDMAAFQSMGVTPDLDPGSQQEFYRLGTRIELFMNPNDRNYNRLQSCLYAFLGAETLEDKYAANPEFISVSQDILKSEWDVLKREIGSVAKD